MAVLEISYPCPGDNCWVSWRYLKGVLDIFEGVMEIFVGCPGDISWVSLDYFLGRIS